MKEKNKNINVLLVVMFGEKNKMNFWIPFFIGLALGIVIQEYIKLIQKYIKSKKEKIKC